MNWLKENWFKVAIIILGTFAVLSLASFQADRSSAEIRYSVFKICMDTISIDAPRDYSALKLNLEICDKLSHNFNKGN